MCYKHNHKKGGGRMDHRRESSTHRSHYCPGKEGLISPAPGRIPTICLISCQLDPSWLRGEGDQDTQQAGQRQPLLPPALIFSHFGSQMQSRRSWWVGNVRAVLGALLAQPAPLAMAQRMPREGRNPRSVNEISEISQNAVCFLL